MVQDGDELIVYRGVDEDVLGGDPDAVREEARVLMRSVQEKSAECVVDRKVSCGCQGAWQTRCFFFFNFVVRFI